MITKKDLFEAGFAHIDKFFEQTLEARLNGDKEHMYGFIQDLSKSQRKALFEWCEEKEIDCSGDELGAIQAIKSQTYKML